MATQRGKEPKAQEVLVVSDLIFGLEKSDSRHTKVIHALNLQRKGILQIRILSSAVIEVRTVMYSRGLNLKVVEESVSLMAGILADFGVDDTVPTEISDIIVAERLRDEMPGLTFFDSLHAAIAKKLRLKLLTSEGIYEELGIETIDLDNILNEF